MRMLRITYMKWNPIIVMKGKVVHFRAITVYVGVELRLHLSLPQMECDKHYAAAILPWGKLPVFLIG